MPASSELIRRSGELKRQMRRLAEEPAYRDALQQTFDDRFGKIAAVDEGEISVICRALASYLCRCVAPARTMDGQPECSKLFWRNLITIRLPRANMPGLRSLLKVELAWRWLNAAG